MKKYILSLMLGLCVSVSSFAQSHSDRISVGVGALYQRGLDATISSCGHVCPESFWNNYRTWGIGAAYKPCVARGRNNYGNLRIGASAGSDTDKFVGGLHVGYEHNFALRHGWGLFVQAKCDLTLPKREDLFRSGIVIGFKIPTLKK